MVALGIYIWWWARRPWFQMGGGGNGHHLVSVYNSGGSMKDEKGAVESLAGWCLPEADEFCFLIVDFLSLSVLTAIFHVSRCLLKQRMMEVVVTTGLLVQSSSQIITTNIPVAWWRETCRVIEQQFWMKECDILGGKTYSNPSYIFSGGQIPNPQELHPGLADVTNTAFVLGGWVSEWVPGSCLTAHQHI